jgi:beta-glucanase (GH16 family)
MYKIIYFTLVGLFLTGANAQSFPLDFEDQQHTFTGFSGSSFSQRTDPADATNNVGQFFNDGNAAAQGFFIDVSNAVDLSNDATVTLRFYAFDPNGHTLLLKLENGSQADVELTQQIPAGANTWRDVSFNFTNATGQYNRLTLFVDFGATTVGTYLIDDINNNAVPANPIDVVYSDLVWSDEFNTPGNNNPVDATNWFHQTQIPSGGSWFNGEVQHYTNRLENSYVENGFLHIMAKRESFTDQGVTKQFTSARLNSKFAFTYGRIDVRAKLPLGDGTWPAIWTLGKNINEAGGFWQPQFGTTNWPFCGEIDVMEHGLGALNHVSAALHTPSSFGNTQNVRERILTDVANTFYVYSMNWSPNQITFLIDDVPFYTYSPAVRDANTYPFNDDQYILLNVAMGGIAGAIDPNFQQSPMVIDYVRVFQNIASVEDNFDASINIYPNPVNDVLHINAVEALDKVEVFHISGQLLLSKTDATDQIDMSSFSSGIYILKAYSRNQVSTKKVVVE